MQVAPGGFRYGLALAVLAAVATAIVPAAGLALAVLALAAVWFHRDPERTTPPAAVVAPADGRIQVLREEDGCLRVGTFMNVHDVHVNRAPLAGEVREVQHEPGGHWPAFTKASDRNERVRVALATDDGDVTLTLIAGAFARRVHPYVSVGDELHAGDRLGHISFGSRVDVLLPPSVDREDLAVERGDAVRAGETVIVPAGALD